MDYYKEISVSRDRLVEIIHELNFECPISEDYIRSIAEAVVDDVAQDIWETADRDFWNDDDVRLAFGRALMKRIGIGF